MAKFATIKVQGKMLSLKVTTNSNGALLSMLENEVACTSLGVRAKGV